MSIMNRARTSVGLTAEQGRSAVLNASGRVASVPAGTRDLTLSAVTQARRQAFATIGATDVIVSTITRQRAELPAQAKHTAVKLAGSARVRVNSVSDRAALAQDKIATAAEQLVERGVAAVNSLAKVTPAATGSRIKDSARGRADLAKDAYAKLAVRGERVATDLRHDPVLVRVIRNADAVVETTANGVTSRAQKIRARASAQAERERHATSSTPVRMTPANKVPAHRTTVRKTPSDEAPISTTPTYRAAAHETATRQAAAKKAAATRKAAAQHAAATRQAAAKKAAATRKASAAEAAAKREATAKKAAATRKKNAAAQDRAASARHSAAVKAAATRKKNAAGA